MMMEGLIPAGSLEGLFGCDDDDDDDDDAWWGRSNRKGALETTSRLGDRLLTDVSAPYMCRAAYPFSHAVTCVIKSYWILLVCQYVQAV